MVDGANATGSTFQRSAQTMLLGKRTNVLLVKDDVGKAKPSTRNLPGQEFSFGKGNKFDESAGDILSKYQYRVDDPKLQFKQQEVKDFKRLNKVVLKEGGTHAAAIRALRQNHQDVKLGVKTGSRMAAVAQSMTNQETVFGRRNRPQTPVNGIISNNYGEKSELDLQAKYAAWKQSRAVSKGPVGIRMTNAQIHADKAVREKNTVQEPKEAFKLKRFQNVNPRTSTKRGDNAYMVLSTQNLPSSQDLNSPTAK